MKKYNFALFLAFFMLAPATVAGQTDSVASYFERQLKIFPQEKIYLHIDKPYYLVGENIWFRAHLVDAVTHIPVQVSRYVYVELIDPLDSVRIRLKVRPDSISKAFAANLRIPDDLPEGQYELRAYTHFMLNTGENYLASRTVRVLYPQARYIRTSARFDFKSERRVAAEIRLNRMSPTGIIVPDKATATVNGKKHTVSPETDGVLAFTFSLPSDAPRVILLETVQDKQLYRQYINVPSPDDDFDVAFYPEGGIFLAGVVNKVAFKALRSNGSPADITGTIVNNEGKVVTSISSDYLGMGCVVMQCEKGKTYHAMVAVDSGVPRRFELPTPQPSGSLLSITWLRKRLAIEIRHSDDQKAPYYLFAHTRGWLNFATKIENVKKPILLPEGQFPTGVLQFLLLDSTFKPLSERLVFINNHDQVQAAFTVPQKDYPTRSLVENTVKLTDAKGAPLAGDFSVAVTSDREVIPDSTVNILTTLLLTSDLRGRIDNPAFYFQETTKSSWLLDLLMLTQGWRRYDVPKVIVGELARPTTYMEIGPAITGQVKSLLLGKPAPGRQVTAVGINRSYAEVVGTDEKGDFGFYDCELPDSTKFMVSVIQVEKEKNASRFELILNNDQYPVRTIRPPLLPDESANDLIAKYADMAELQYTNANGERTVYLEEVTITAQRKPVRKSEYYSTPDGSITEEQLERFTPTSMYNLLMRLPGVSVMGNKVSIRGQGDPLLLVDGLPMDINDIETINPLDVAQVDVLKNAGTTAIFGSRGGNGVIVVFTKNGKINRVSKPFHIKMFMPLGYCTPAEFYSPKYDTPEARNENKPDLRTTILWQPSVKADSTGIAKFNFYTADATGKYTVVIEGLSADGKVIHKEEKIGVK